ncbi:MAG TPA: hypothetical protein DIV39_09310, partial [Verrucomicrobiales bacterium]|nr:hypothetical protein [Verrucomicrobiales bacterium]
MARIASNEGGGAPSGPPVDSIVTLPEVGAEPEHQRVHGFGGQNLRPEKRGHPVLVFLGALVIVA